MVDKLRNRVKNGGSKAPAAPQPSPATQIAAEHEMLTKIGIGASLVVGAVSLVGAYTNLSHAVTKDEQGKKHVDATNLMWGIVNLALAAANGAFAYYGSKGLKQGAGRI